MTLQSSIWQVFRFANHVTLFGTLFQVFFSLIKGSIKMSGDFLLLLLFAGAAIIVINALVNFRLLNCLSYSQSYSRPFKVIAGMFYILSIFVFALITVGLIAVTLTYFDTRRNWHAAWLFWVNIILYASITIAGIFISVQRPLLLREIKRKREELVSSILPNKP